MLIKIVDQNKPEPILPKKPEEVEQDLRNALQAFKLPEQEDLTKVPARVGTPLPVQEVIDKIQRLSGYLVWVENSINCPGGANFYRYNLKDSTKECLGCAFWRFTEEGEPAMLPQWTVWHEDGMELVDDKTTGWMEILSKLIQKGALRKKDVMSEFPIGNEDVHAARFWKQQMKEFN